MTTIIKERLQWLANISGRDDIDDIDGSEIRELARSVLVSLDAEPAGYHVIKENGKVGCSVATLEEAEKTRDFWNKRWTIRPYFYSATPVVPPAIEPDYKVIKSILPTANPDEYACCIAADMWNACRAAMLQANQRDLSQPVDPQVAEYEQIMLQAGWVMVPKTVTPEISLAINKVGQHCTCGNCSQRVWDMLLAAAPKQEGNNE
ncbi:hypothetical protein DQT85_11395 [Salmonella enterica subsp. enterica]|nr:hypothetical protein [Salmonella enterica subsp. enterica serovar Senftenberg]ECP2143263.1 hypothetical protein [Salmonella enterica]EAA6563724.1 hypothetical protein [Salmonella enterica subsp. enterica serovar Senftenberg]EBU8759735.1 hypothetical protein [Salmonella enterica subsp. enterica serovar Senftenberg]EDH5624436.1 hypothetical protein [Salmonella enterica subsp. enterica serovar Senftenberg]